MDPAERIRESAKRKLRLLISPSASEIEIDEGPNRSELLREAGRILTEETGIVPRPQIGKDHLPPNDAA